MAIACAAAMNSERGMGETGDMILSGNQKTRIPSRTHLLLLLNYSLIASDTAGPIFLDRFGIFNAFALGFFPSGDFPLVIIWQS